MRGELQAKPISVNGTDYPSTAAAIRSLRDAGLTRAQIAAATGAKLYFVNVGQLDADRRSAGVAGQQARADARHHHALAGDDRRHDGRP